MGASYDRKHPLHVPHLNAHSWVGGRQPTSSV